MFFSIPEERLSVPLCYSFKGPSTTATTAMVSSLSAAKVLCNTLLFISGFSPEELPTIASEYLFKNSNLRLFYIHTVVIFMNKDGNYVSLFVRFICDAPDPLPPLTSSQKLKTRCSSCCFKIHSTAFGSNCSVTFQPLNYSYLKKCDISMGIVLTCKEWSMIFIPSLL